MQEYNQLCQRAQSALTRLLEKQASYLRKRYDIAYQNIQFILSTIALVEHNYQEEYPVIKINFTLTEKYRGEIGFYLAEYRLNGDFYDEVLHYDL